MTSPPLVLVPEPISALDPNRVAHLALSRGIIVRRTLLSTAIGSFLPIPILDDLVATRIRAGLLIRLAAARGVDLPAPAAQILAESRTGSILRTATVSAVTMLALKLAWRKFFVLLAAGRGADEMADRFQFATLFDHYAARIHVGGAITNDLAAALRRTLNESVDAHETRTVVGVFRDGARILGQSLLEAPKWLTARFTRLGERFVRSGGNPDILRDDVDAAADEAPGPWLDRAARTVDDGLGGLGTGYLVSLVDTFEDRWRRQAPIAPPPASATIDAKK